MKLSVIFCGLSRPRDEITRLECVFRDAMLNYCPSVEKLAQWQETRNWNYSRAYWYGRWAANDLLTPKEAEKYTAQVRFIK